MSANRYGYDYPQGVGDWSIIGGDVPHIVGYAAPQYGLTARMAPPPQYGPPPQPWVDPRLAWAAQMQRMNAGVGMPGALGNSTVRPDVPGLQRRVPVPFADVYAVVASAAAGTPGVGTVITINPQEPIRVERLLLSSSALTGLVITRFDVGVTPQLSANGIFPAEGFSSVARDTMLRGGTAGPGLVITLVISNITTTAATVSGMIIGESLKRG